MQYSRSANGRRTWWSNASSTDSFDTFLREPKVLDGVRVIVWITASDSIFRFRFMPAPILETLKETR
jgi:hypothetical protein